MNGLTLTPNTPPGGYFTWRRQVIDAIERCIATMDEFTSDDVWAQLADPDLDTLTAEQINSVSSTLRSYQRDRRIRKTNREALTRRPNRRWKLVVWEPIRRPHS